MNYCFEHANRPNPIQDLIDKGFLPSGFKETCLEVKQTYDKEQTIINNNLEIERHKQQVKQDAYFIEQDPSASLSVFSFCINLLDLHSHKVTALFSV